jgi:tripartite-type tricarboxylate transporter receptor subunit TctC
MEAAMNIARHQCVWVASLAFAAAAAPVASQSYPVKPLRNILTIAGGGETNARIVAERLSQLLGQPIVVEAQAGAGGAVGATTVARSAPDGYTFLYGTTSAMVLRQFLVADMPYDTLRDFIPVSQLGNATSAIVANKDIAPNSLRELIDYARKNPGKISYGSTGTGTTHHLTGVVISQLTGADLLHVPYKGAPPAIVDLLAGRIQLAMSTSSSFVQLINAGKIKLMAINENRRMPQYPDTPTVFEVVPGYEHIPSWFGYFVPAGTPQAIVKRLATDIDRAAHTPAVKEKLESVGSLINTLPPEEFMAHLKRQMEQGARLMKQAGIKPGSGIDS